MRIARAVFAEVVGLFVSDWRQTVGILVILLAGYLATRVLPASGVGFGVALLLALHLIYTTHSEAGRDR